jgi:ABC-type sugar transport system permease subunit
MASAAEGVPIRGSGVSGDSVPGFRRPRTRLQEIARARTSYLLLLPIFIVLIVFVYYPPLSALVYSFFAWDPTAPSQKFVGWANYVTVLQDPHFGQEVVNMLVLLVATVVTSVTAPLVVAELIYAVRNSGARYAYRFLFLVPVVVPTVVIILMWQFFYDPNLGPINASLGAVGLGGLQRNWLSDFSTALPALIFVGFPWTIGTNVLIYLSGLLEIPGEVVEAAALDGVTGLRRILKIDLPLLLGQVRLFLVLGSLAGLQSFQLQLVISNPPGGPGWQTTVPALDMYTQAFNNGHFGRAAAIGMLLFLVAAGLTAINFRVVRSSVLEGAD